MGNSNKKNEILYNKVLENKISSILKNEYTSHDEIKDIKKFLKKKKNEDLIRSNFRDKFLQKDKGITTVKNLIDLIYQLNPNLKRNKKRNKPRKNLLFENDSNEEDDEEEENEDEEDKVGDEDEDENENESKNTNNEIENEEEDEQDYNNNSNNNNNNNDTINQKNNYFSDIQHNESDSLNSLNYMNNVTQKDDVFNLKSSNNYGGTKQLNESKRKSYNNNNTNYNHSIQSTSTFRKTEQSIKTTKQIKSIPIKKKPQNHKIVKIDIAEMKKHCFLQDVKDTYLRKTEANTRPYFSTMDPIEKEVYELTMKKTHKEPKLGDDNFLSMIDILTQPNKKREDRIHSRSPIRKSNYQTATSTYDNNTNTFMQKTKYQNTHYNKYNETQNKNQKRK